MNTTEALVRVLSSNTASALGGAIIIVLGGIQILRRIKPGSPLAPYALQFAGLTIVVPVLLVLAIATELSMEALTGFFGTIVGYFFGVGGQARKPIRDEEVVSKPETDENEDSPGS